MPERSSAETDTSTLVEEKIQSFGGWRTELLREIRRLILAADAEITEDLKWRGTPVWSKNGILCTGEAYQSTVKVTFAKGAQLPDPAGLFNASLDGNLRRAIDFKQGDAINASAFTELVLCAIALNADGKHA